MDDTLSKPMETLSDRSLSHLMNRIVERHHTFCRQEVARLSVLFREVNAVHAKSWPELREMESLFAGMAKDLQMHLVKEEKTLFPYIAHVEEAVGEGAAVSWPLFGTIGNPIRMMTMEHDQTGGELKQIRKLARDYALPPEAPESLRKLFDGLRSFEQDMTEHVHAEDDLLFPHAIAMEEQACTRTKLA